MSQSGMSKDGEDEAVDWLMETFNGDYEMWVDPVAIKARIAELEAERDALKQKVAHLDKLADLYPISLGNACEERDKLKHSDRALRKENAALRKALEDAPHERYCLSEWERNMFRRKEPQPNACDCWKATIPLPTPQTLAASSDHGCNSPVSLSEDKPATDLRQSSGERAGNNQ